MLAVRRRGTSDVRLMVRVAQLYYGMHLSQAEIGERLGPQPLPGRPAPGPRGGGVDRPDRGRAPLRPARGPRGRAGLPVPPARAVVADVPAAAAGEEADDLARDAVAEVAVDLLAKLRPTGAIAVSWGRTMLAVAAACRWAGPRPTGSSSSTGPPPRSTHPTRANEILERFAATSGATFRGLAAPAIVGSADLRDALMEDAAIRETVDAARSAPAAVFGLGIPAPRTARTSRRGSSTSANRRGSARRARWATSSADSWTQRARSPGPSWTAARLACRSGTSLQAVPHGRSRGCGPRTDRARGDPGRRRQRAGVR